MAALAEEPELLQALARALRKQPKAQMPAGLTFLHVFPYSPRPGTPAARMPQVPRPEVKRRAARLREKGAGILARWLAWHQDTEMEFYVECNAVCRTAQFTEAHVSGLEGADPGSAVRARVVGHDGRRLLAEASA